jgi:hypothetical protein
MATAWRTGHGEAVSGRAACARRSRPSAPPRRHLNPKSQNDVIGQILAAQCVLKIVWYIATFSRTAAVSSAIG